MKLYLFCAFKHLCYEHQYVLCDTHRFSVGYRKLDVFPISLEELVYFFSVVLVEDSQIVNSIELGLPVFVVGFELIFDILYDLAEVDLLAIVGEFFKFCVFDNILFPNLVLFLKVLLDSTLVSQMRLDILLILKHIEIILLLDDISENVFVSVRMHLSV